MDPEKKVFAKPFFEVIESVEPLDAHTVLPGCPGAAGGTGVRH
jgi:hypothetical protein